MAFHGTLHGYTVTDSVLDGHLNPDFLCEQLNNRDARIDVWDDPTQGAAHSRGRECHYDGWRALLVYHFVALAN